MNTRFNPSDIWSPNGRAFSQGVVQGDGKVLHITGQVAWDENSNVVGLNDVRRQLEKSISNMEKILSCVGGKLEDIVSMTIYFLHREDLPIIQQVRAEHFRAETAPVSILIQVPGLVNPELLIEIVPIAVIPHERYHDPSVT